MWTQDVGEVELRTALAQRPGTPLALYVHIPFCRSLCTYCACDREISRDARVADGCLDALSVEAERLAETLEPARAVIDRLPRKGC